MINWNKFKKKKDYFYCKNLSSNRFKEKIYFYHPLLQGFKILIFFQKNNNNNLDFQIIIITTTNNKHNNQLIIVVEINNNNIIRIKNYNRIRMHKMKKYNNK